MPQNNCDGSGPHLSGEVRVLPLGKDPNHGNLIVCRSCYNREIDYRVERNADVAQPYDLPAWTELEVYGEDDMDAENAGKYASDGAGAGEAGL